MAVEVLSPICLVLFSVRDEQIYMIGAIFRPRPNSNPINTNTLTPTQCLTLILTILTLTIYRGQKLSWSKSNYPSLGTEKSSTDSYVL